MAAVIFGWLVALDIIAKVVVSLPCPVPIALPVLLNVTRIPHERNSRLIRTTTVVSLRSEYSTDAVVWKAKYGDDEYPLSPWDDDLEVRSTYTGPVGVHLVTFGRYGAEVSNLLLSFDVHCTQLVLDIALIPNQRFRNLTSSEVRFGKLTVTRLTTTIDERNSTWRSTYAIETEDDADLLQFQATPISVRNGSELSSSKPELGAAFKIVNDRRGNVTELVAELPFEFDDVVVRIHGLWLPSQVQDAIQSIHTHVHVSVQTPYERPTLIEVTTCQYRDQARHRFNGEVLVVPQRALTPDCILVRVDASPMRRVNIAEMDSRFGQIETILEVSSYVVKTETYREIMYVISPHTDDRHYYVSVNDPSGSINKLLQLAVYHPVRVAGGITPPFIYISEPVRITFTCEVNGDHIMDYGIFIRRTWASDDPKNWLEYVRPERIRTLTVRDRYLLYQTSVVITPGQVRAVKVRREVIFCGVKSAYNHATFSFDWTP